MKKIHILLLLLSVCSIETYSQTLEQAKTLFKKGEYAKAKPVFQKYVKSSPKNASYNHWYGVCLFETGDKYESEKYLLLGAEKKVQESYRYLAELYFDEYRFEESVENYEEYIAMLEKKKQSVEKYEKLLNKSKLAARMIKGVEDVCFIDSFVVDKTNFLNTYKISEESGRLFTYNQYFETKGDNPGTVYLTERENKLFFGDKIKDKDINIYSQTKLLDNWSKASLLPDVINTPGNVNYPYVLSDGITLYYASNGEGSLGGYDIFVTRYNSNSDNYLVPDNVGMPFNSPFNDYMYAVDEYSNLGWFASDRYQPEDKVCIYVFIPNTSKQTYNYEATDNTIVRRAAMIQSIKVTWKNMEEVKAAQQRLSIVTYSKPEQKKKYDFTFIIDDLTEYHYVTDFTAPLAQSLFKQLQQKEHDLDVLQKQLYKLRENYSQSNTVKKNSLAPGIIDTEKRVEQLEEEVKDLVIKVRNEEKKYLSR